MPGGSMPMWMPGGGGPPDIMLMVCSMPIPGGMGGIGMGGMGGMPGICRGGNARECEGSGRLCGYEVCPF